MPRILVVDDEPLVRDTLEAILSDAGHDVFLAPDGRRGVERLRSQGFDLVITDLLMPEKDGIETILEIRERCDVPILAISGGGRLGNKSFLGMAQHFGAHDSLEKPFSPDELLRKVSALLTVSPARTSATREPA